MHEQKTYGINWKDVIIKIILLILFVLLLIWIIPRPDLNTFYDAVYNNNLQTMKEAARNYYHVDRLPEKIGEQKSMSLQDMLKGKIIVPFVDKENKSCDTENSYVQVSKTGDQEYVMKVQLACDTQIDYILDTIGCYDVCVGKDCETTPDIPQTESTVLEYQQRKLDYKSVDVCSCPEGYVKDGNKCYKKTTKKENATPVYSKDTTTVTDANKNEGEEYKVFTDAIVKVTPEKYSCPEGYKPEGSGENLKCYKIDTKEINSSTTYSCPATYPYPEGSEENLKCYNKKYGERTTSITSYNCPSGGTPNGATCVKDESYSYGAISGTYYCNNYWNIGARQWTTGIVYASQSDTRRVVPLGSEYAKTCNTCSYRYIYYYRVDTRYCGYTAATCSGGQSPVNNMCYATRSANYTGTPIYGYTCPSTYPNAEGSGTDLKCWTKEYGNVTSKTKTSCDDGYTINDGKCVKIDYVNNIHTEEIKKYSCPEGFDSEGEGENLVCFKIQKSDEEYYCSDVEAVLKDKKCYKTTKGKFLHYSCPDGYKLEGNMCYKTVKTDEKDASCETKEKEEYTYKWSKDKELEGWEFTGKTREILTNESNDPKKTN